MGMTSIVFRESCKNLNNFSEYLSSKIPLKAYIPQDPLSYLWTQTQERFNQGSAWLGSVVRSWTDVKTTIVDKTENTKKKFEIANREQITATLVGTVFSELAISYYRPDYLAFSILSSLVKPALFFAGATLLIAGNARGSGIPKEEVMKNPWVRITPILHSCLQAIQQQPQDDPTTRIGKLYEQAKGYGSIVATEMRGALRGTIVLFLECGGQPQALLTGIGAGELALLLGDAGYSVDPGFLATTITVGLAAASALAVVIYSTPLPEPIQKEASVEIIELLDEKEVPSPYKAIENTPQPIDGERGKA